ncbi:MAG TPA: hypothetical protein ENO18_00850 [Caldithrix sp.]|nr:hypothetical protein [Caldithrix sp.]
MKQSDIRNNFHQLIDDIENESLLMKFYEMMLKSKVQNEGELWSQLSEEQKNEVLLAESESHYENNLIDHKDQKIKHKKWL